MEFGFEDFISKHNLKGLFPTKYYYVISKNIIMFFPISKRNCHEDPREVFHYHNGCRFEIYSSIDNLESWEQSRNLISSSNDISLLAGRCWISQLEPPYCQGKIGIMKITFLFLSKEGCENRNMIIAISKHFRNGKLLWKSCSLFRILNYFFIEI